MVINIAKAVYDMALAFMKNAGMSPKAAAKAAKAAVPGGSKADTDQLLRKLEDAKLAGTLTLTHKELGLRLVCDNGRPMAYSVDETLEDAAGWQALRSGEYFTLKHTKSGQLLAAGGTPVGGRVQVQMLPDDESAKYDTKVRWCVDWSSDALILSNDQYGSLSFMGDVQTERVETTDWPDRVQWKVAPVK